MKKIRTTNVSFSLMLHGRQTYDGGTLELERDEIVGADPNGFVTVDGKCENTATLYLKTWKEGGRKNYSPGIACTVHVLESDLEKVFPDLAAKIKEARVRISRGPDPDKGSPS